MTDISNAWEIENYTAPDGTAWRVFVVQDESPESPRDWDNTAQLLTKTRSYHSPDHGRDADPLGIMDKTAEGWGWSSRMRGLYLAARTDVLAWAMLDQSERDGSLYLTFYDNSADIGETMHDGVAYVTREAWEATRGTGEYTDREARDAIRGEVDSFNQYARGEVCGFVVEQQVTWQALNADGTLGDEGRTMDTWELVESVWGFYSTEDAMSEGRASLPDGAVKND